MGRTGDGGVLGQGGIKGRGEGGLCGKMGKANEGARKEEMGQDTVKKGKYSKRKDKGK